MDDWDPTDRVIVIVHQAGPAAVLDDDGPTMQDDPRLDDCPTDRLRCEFEEDTIAEHDWR